MLLFTRAGDLLVANPSEDRILLLDKDEDGDGIANGKRLVLDNLNRPNGLDFHGDWLYVAETDAIGRVPFDHSTGTISGDYERIVTGLPGGGNHWQKTLRFGPDGLMYVTIGSSCNACLEQDKRRGAMLRYQPDGSGEEIYARGLRNSAGFDWSPKDGQLYATDNGRDLLGDDFPPCELNRVELNEHYGWPFANGAGIPDPDFGEGQEEIIANSLNPVHGFRAHNAPLGIQFVQGTSLPEYFHGTALVALHGSWNRSEKDGYKVVSLHWDENGNVREENFLTGFLMGDDVIGRPVELEEGPDGAIYVSDDYAGVIYRVAYGEAQKSVVSQSELPPKTLPQFEIQTTLSLLSVDERHKASKKGPQLVAQYNCMSCHQGVIEGQKKLSDLGRKYDVETLSLYLEKPRPPMPSYPMSDSDRRFPDITPSDRKR
jgi:glucose/arabinose dehydrogenase